MHILLASTYYVVVLPGTSGLAACYLATIYDAVLNDAAAHLHLHSAHSALSRSSLLQSAMSHSLPY